MKRYCSASLLIIVLALTSWAADRPNVVLIISDDQAWSDYGFMGHPEIRTPNLDQLASEGLLFRHGYVTAPLCRPSLATIITGLYPHQHGITGNDPALPDGGGLKQRGNPKYQHHYETLTRRIETHPTLPRMLAQHGYVSLQSGKWWEGTPARGGFSEGMTHGDPARGGRHGDEGLKIGREGLLPIRDFIDRAVADDKRFFLWYAPFMPHTPHTPPERWLAGYRDKAPEHVARYWAMCTWFDETCGELLDYLAQKDLTENTLIVFIADNGWIQRPDSKGYARRSKRSPYEGGIRTPIIVRWPAKVKPNQQSETLASSIDIAPTVLAACGFRATHAMAGVNLLDENARQQRQQIFGAAYAHDVADVDNPTKSMKQCWTIHRPWKLIVPNASHAWRTCELYNLDIDPHEKHNIIGTQAKYAAALHEELRSWWPDPENLASHPTE